MTGQLSIPQVTPFRIALGEWVKFRSVRSTVITLVTGALVTILLGAVFALSANGGRGAPGPTGNLTDPVAISLAATNLSQLIIGIVGVLVVAGEYSTGLIRTTFNAVGSRLGVLLAKAGVVGTAVFLIMAVSTTIALVVGQALYAGNEPTVSLGDPGVLRVLFGATLYLTGISLMGIALGFILRSTAASIGVLVVGLFIAPTLIGLLPSGISDAILKYFPSKAGESMMALSPGADLLSVGPAFAVFGGWVVVMLVVAGFLVQRRDA